MAVSYPYEINTIQTLNWTSQDILKQNITYALVIWVTGQKPFFLSKRLVNGLSTFRCLSFGGGDMLFYLNLPSTHALEDSYDFSIGEVESWLEQSNLGIPRYSKLLENGV